MNIRGGLVAPIISLFHIFKRGRAWLPLKTLPSMRKPILSRLQKCIVRKQRERKRIGSRLPLPRENKKAKPTHRKNALPHAAAALTRPPSSKTKHEKHKHTGTKNASTRELSRSLPPPPSLQKTRKDTHSIQVDHRAPISPKNIEQEGNKKHI